MRVLIVSAALLAVAVAAPSGALLGHGLSYAHAPLALAHAAPLAVAHAAAIPTISPGDIQGAVIEAHVDASDHARAAIDQHRELHDQASEIHGQHINAAEDHSWQALDAAKTHEAQLDGAAAGAAPVIAKSLAYSASAAYAAPALSYAAPAVSYAAPAVSYAAHAAPAVSYASPAVSYAAHAAPAVSYAAPAVSYAAHAAPALSYAAHAAPALSYAAHAPVVAAHAPIGHSSSVSTQSLSQTHPAPVYSAYAAPLAHAVHAAPLAHAVHAAPYAHSVHAW